MSGRCRGQTGGAYGSLGTYGEGMVQRTNAACGGRESVSVMKGEVDSSILSGSTSRLLAHGAALSLAPLQVAASLRLLKTLMRDVVMRVIAATQEACFPHGK